MDDRIVFCNKLASRQNCQKVVVIDDPMMPRYAVEQGGIDVWRIPLSVPGWYLTDLSHFLADEEIATAERFHSRQHRDRFVAARGTLRSILARYAGVLPKAIRFGYGKHGKPWLANDATIDFNLSHSEDLAMLAVGNRSPVGIDIECVKPGLVAPDLIDMIFSQQEKSKLAELSSNEMESFFFRIWTAKESYLKLLGSGLSIDPRCVEVTPDGKDSLTSSRAAIRPTGGHARPLHGLDAPAGYVATLATDAFGVEITTRVWRIPDMGLV